MTFTAMWSVIGIACVWGLAAGFLGIRVASSNRDFALVVCGALCIAAGAICGAFL